MNTWTRRLAKTGAVIAVLVAGGYWWFGDRHPDFFTADEVALLNAGGEISSERFEGYDEVCFYAPTLFRIMDNDCWHYSGGLGLIKDGVCHTFSMRRIRTRITEEYDYKCRKLPSAFSVTKNPRTYGSILIVD